MDLNIKKIKKLLLKLNIDGLLIKSKITKKYLGTLTGSGVNVLITKDKSYLILDGRYVSEAREKKTDFEIIENTPAQSQKSHFHVVNEIFKQYKYSNLGLESQGYSISDYEKLKEYDFNIVLVGEEINKVRIIKDDSEISILKEACEITDKIFDHVLNHIKVGITEQEINAWIYYYSLKYGASKLSFDPVITSGTRTCLPHGRPTDKIIEDGDVVMIDFGIEYKNYQSDMTRTVFVGKPNEKILEIYEVVKKAQSVGVGSIKSGKKASDADFEVRKIINEAGYGKYYNHGLGHGIGIGDGSEYPFLNETSDTILQNNMVMSCEPGIYIPGLGGVRIEDDVWIKDGVGIPLNKTTKEIITLEG
ncbi:M24 family metallopeptidase [Terrisporobacter petrolearius]|uniref:M24 family metallopeptidase n=1 Tax=Terrisporobacter petrolearius TaxID=1460447 RepID=UPI0031CCD3EE